MLGLFGTLFACIQFFLLEFHSFKAIAWERSTILYTVGFVVCLSFMYFSTSSFLSKSDSALFNLSLLTSDIYAVLFSYLVYHYSVPWLYYIAFILSVSGLYFYHSAGQPVCSNSYYSELSAAVTDELSPFQDAITSVHDLNPFQNEKDQP